MYQSNCFILQTTNNNLWYFFYSPDGSICYSIYSNKHWSNPVTVVSDVSYNFSVNLTSDDDIYVFCQDSSGNVMVCLYKDKEWTQKVILENKSNEIHNINFQILFNNQTLDLIYSMPIAEKNSQMVYQYKDSNNKWTSPQILDTIIPFKFTPFAIQKVNDNISVVFYEKKGSECSLGYREFSPTLKKWGNFNNFHTTSYMYVDQSFLTTEDTIHVLYIVKTTFSNQLIYKYKSGSDWSSPIMLYEANKIDICSLFIVDNQLWAIWYINSKLFTCVSQNLGKTFNKPSRYQGNYIANPMKANFITNIKQKEEKLYLREILLCDYPIPEILLIPHLYPDFYNLELNTKVEVIHKASTEPTVRAMVNDDSFKDQMSILKNKITSYEQKINEQNLQITSLIKEKAVLNKTKEILENQIQQQSIEILSLQNQLDGFGVKKVEYMEEDNIINEDISIEIEHLEEIDLTGDKDNI